MNLRGRDDLALHQGGLEGDVGVRLGDIGQEFGHTDNITGMVGYRRGTLKVGSKLFQLGLFRGSQGQSVFHDHVSPVDRPNLSKDFLAGTAGEDWIPLRTREYYESIQVDLVTDDPVVRIQVR